MERYKITVFTPTYNRAEYLHTLYISLISQSYTDFEWLIVDDGSTDDTESLIAAFSSERKIPIRYIRQENQGKHSAVNVGVKNAKGCLFFIVDSDDYLLQDALEKVSDWESKLDKSHKYCGLAGLRQYPDGGIIGTSFSGDVISCTSLERGENGISGDKAEVFYTEVLEKYPFPVFPGESFLTEAYVWNSIAADGYLIEWHNDPIYVCEYLPNGLTSKVRELEERNPKGYAAYLIKETEWFCFSYKEKINSYYQYYHRMKDKLSLNEIAENLNCSNGYLAWARIRFAVRDAIKGKAY